jgi:acetaldehyde dehydrogenase (acetylating)
MSLGCGAYAGNITSDNITPLHLINVKRLAYELPRERPAVGPVGGLRDQVAAFVQQHLGTATAAARPPAGGPPAPQPAPPPAVPPPARPVSTPVLDFVAEEDVRRAAKDGKTLRVSRKAIITPSARDFAAGKNILIEDRD